jgi:hypothetical protein
VFFSQALANVAALTAVYELSTIRTMMDAMVHEVASRLEEPGTDAAKQLTPKHLSEILNACAQARYHPGDVLLNAILKAIRVQDLCLQVWHACRGSLSQHPNCLVQVFRAVRVEKSA